MKTSIKYLIIFYAIFYTVITTLGFGLGMYIGRIYSMRQAPVKLEAGAVLPSQSDIQRILVERGYDIKVDGIIGAESRMSWDLAICDEYYKESLARISTEERPGAGQFKELK